MEKNIGRVVKIITFFSIVMVLFFAKADECGLEGLTTGGAGAGTSTVECQTHFYCCDNKVYNGCGTRPDNCRVITSDEIQAYNNGGPCTCGCTYYCWKTVVNGQNQYQIAENAPSAAWTNIGKEGEVTCSEAPACYQNKANGTYHWGTYNGNTGYEKITTVSSEANCNNFCWTTVVDGQNKYETGIVAPSAIWSKVGKVGEVTCSETPACYRNIETHAYAWGTYSGNEEYQRIAEIDNKDSCGPAPACYYNSVSGYVWGEYSTSSGYEKVTTVEDSDNCADFCWTTVVDGQNQYFHGLQAPAGTWTRAGKYGEVTCSETPACYQNKTTKGYVWGNYKDSEDYDLISEKNETECHDPEVPVPATGINKTAFFIGMLMVGIVGVAIVLYSKKLSRSTQA